LCCTVLHCPRDLYLRMSLWFIFSSAVRPAPMENLLE
jgi:hypothetical protein